MPIFVAPRYENDEGKWVPQGGDGYLPSKRDAEGNVVRPAKPGCGYVLGRWDQRAKADPAVVDQWVPGDALCAVMGVVDCIDVDTQNDGDRASIADAMPTVYGRASTPSGGTHELIAPLGLKNGRVDDGIDLKTVGGIIFLAPTRKMSKVDGKVRTYQWTEPPNLDLMLLGGPQDGADLREHVEQYRGRTTPGEYTGEPYAGPAYANLTSDQQTRADRHRDDVVETWESRLEAVALIGEDGATDEHGCTWGETARKAGFALACMVHTPWIDLTEEQACEIYDSILPDAIAEVDPGGSTGWGPKRAMKRAAERPAPPAPWQSESGFDALDDEDVQSIEVLELTGYVTRTLARAGLQSRGMRLPGPANLPAVADDLLKRLWTDEQCTVLRYWHGALYEWHTTHWQEIPATHIEAVLQRVLEASTYEGFEQRGERRVKVVKKWSPHTTTGTINELVKQLQRKLLIHSQVQAGHWIACAADKCPTEPQNRRYISFQNGILDLGDHTLFYEHHNSFFNTYSLGFDYQPEAQCPRWEQALEDWFPGDTEAQGHLEEVIAHLTLGGLRLDKIFVWLGESRAGKGTVMRLVQKMMGAGYSAMSMDDLSDRFAMEDLIGLEVCHIAETTTARDTRKAVSLMKSISGADYEGSKIKRKGQKSEMNVTLTVKFVMSGNEDLTLTDDSGAVIGRLDTLYWGVSFLGREDPLLEPTLHNEMPGIFNRVMRAHARLLERGRLVQPKSGERIKSQMRTAAAPAKSWFEDTYEVTGNPQDSVKADDIIEAYRMDVDPKIGHRAASMKVSSLLTPHGGKVHKDRFTEGSQRYYVYYGLRARDEEIPFEVVPDEEVGME